MLSQEHFIGYVTTTSNNTFTNNFETNGAPYADLKPAGPINNKKPKDDLDIKQACEHRKEKPACPKHRHKSSDVKEINQVEIVCTEKSQGCGTLSICYHTYYRSVLVAVMEFRMSSNKSRVKLSANFIKKQGWLTI